jgi:large subunit ribosomal protein L17
MRHRSAHRKLGRKTEHRISLLRNLAASLITSKGRIRTTEAKAKELRPFVEKLVTLGKRDSLHARRRALSIIPRKEVVSKLFSDVSPRFAERPGGYTRILKLAHRQGDGAPMAFIQFVDFKFEGAAAGKPEAKGETKKTDKNVKESKAKADDSDEDQETRKTKARKPAAAKKKSANKKKAEEDDV